jgi:hypothetical protein
VQFAEVSALIDNRVASPSFSRATTFHRLRSAAVSSGFSEADEGTRTLDLLHGNNSARGDRSRLEPSFGLGMRILDSGQRQEMAATD